MRTTISGRGTKEDWIRVKSYLRTFHVEFFYIEEKKFSVAMLFSTSWEQIKNL